MSLPVPADHLTSPAELYDKTRPPHIPAINLPQSVQHLLVDITVMVANELAFKASKNPLRIFGYNLLSSNGFNNQYFSELVGIVGGYTDMQLRKQLTTSAEHSLRLNTELIVGCYISSLFYQFPGIQSRCSPELKNGAAMNQGYFNNLKQELSNMHYHPGVQYQGQQPMQMVQPGMVQPGMVYQGQPPQGVVYQQPSNYGVPIAPAYGAVQVGAPYPQYQNQPPQQYYPGQAPNPFGYTPVMATPDSGTNRWNDNSSQQQHSDQSRYGDPVQNQTTADGHTTSFTHRQGDYMAQYTEQNAQEVQQEPTPVGAVNEIQNGDTNMNRDAHSAIYADDNTRTWATTRNAFNHAISNAFNGESIVMDNTSVLVVESIQSLRNDLMVVVATQQISSDDQPRSFTRSAGIISTRIVSNVKIAPFLNTVLASQSITEFVVAARSAHNRINEIGMPDTHRRGIHAALRNVENLVRDQINRIIANEMCTASLRMTDLVQDYGDLIPELIKVWTEGQLVAYRRLEMDLCRSFSNATSRKLAEEDGQSDLLSKDNYVNFTIPAAMLYVPFTDIELGLSDYRVTTRLARTEWDLSKIHTILSNTMVTGSEEEGYTTHLNLQFNDLYFTTSDGSIYRIYRITDTEEIGVVSVL